MERSLLEQLECYSQSDYYPFHMPGHKRNFQVNHIPAAIDITEIEGFDNLHHAQSVLQRAQQRAAELYGAEESFFLVNGSTCGILAAVSASVSKNGTILLARNSHKAAYHGVFLRNLQVDYVYPETWKEYGICGGIAPQKIEAAFQADSRIEAVLVTSPTYEGMVSNIKEIADITHRHKAVLIVDEAHGAHFGLAGEGFPQSALSYGADLVIQSLHKTLPSLTQTALLHVQGLRADRRRLRKYLQIYQTSSPSYVLMAGMDSCIRLLEERGKELFKAYRLRLARFYEEAGKLRYLHVLQPGEVEGTADVCSMDPSKICIFTKGTKASGSWLYHVLLERYHLQLEMAAGEYTLAMTSLMDRKEGFQRLAAALREIDEEFCAGGMAGRLVPAVPAPEVVMTSAQAEEQERETVSLKACEGRISLEYRYVYPPGIPVLVPGERITDGVLALLSYYRRKNLNIQGQEESGGMIAVVKEQTWNV